MYRKLASALLVAGAISSQSAVAVSLGEITMNSALNEPLDAMIKLTNVKDFDASQILVKLASADEFDKAGIERTFFLSDIKFTVEVDGSGNGYVHLTSDRRVNEPFLDILLEGRWPTGRMLRSYTVLVDLPVYKESQPAVVEKKTQGKSKPGQVEASVDEKKTSTVAQSSQVDRSQSKQIDQNLKSDEYFTQKNDTLWVIARNHSAGTDLSINQTMAAIQQHNPQAFINGNVNLLKQGVVLRLPDEQAIREITQQQATQTVAQQNKEWREAQLDNKESSQEVEEVSSKEDQGHLSLTSAGAGIVAGDEDSGDVIEGLQEQLRAAQDEVAASQLESQELNSRVSSLNSQIEQLKRLIELKDAELANLQQELGDKAVVGNEEIAVLEADLQNAESELDQATAAEVSVVEEETVEIVDITETPAEEKQAVVPVLKEKVEQKESKLVKEKPASEKPKAPAEKESSLSLWETVQQNPIYIGLLGLLIAIGMGAFLLRRRAKDESQVAIDNSSFTFDSDETSQEELVEEEETAEQVDEQSETGELLTGDPIEEADVYLQFGRYSQAAAILEKAVQTDPANAAVAAKLAETYVQANDIDACTELHQNLLNQGETVSVAAVENYLQNDEKGAEWLRSMQPEKAPVITASIVEALVEPETATDELLDLEYEAPVLAELQETSEVESSSDELSDLEDGFDFDLDLSGFDENEGADALDAEPAIEEELELEFTLDLDEPIESSPQAASSDEDELDLSEFDFDSGLEDVLASDEISTKLDDTAEEAELSLDDFDLDFDEFAVGAELELDTAEVDDAADYMLNTEELDLAEAEEALVETKAADDEESLSFADSADEVATKLDLAQAYIDMGDVEGAKDLLDEVLDQGDEMQKQEAKELLSQLD